jgi:hypothetical protein
MPFLKSLKNSNKGLLTRGYTVLCLCPIGAPARWRAYRAVITVATGVTALEMQMEMR